VSPSRAEQGDGDELVKYATNSTQGFTRTLAGLKAFLEHNVRLNLVADRFPRAGRTLPRRVNLAVRRPKQLAQGIEMSWRLLPVRHRYETRML
jgi:hypothetical protein